MKRKTNQRETCRSRSTRGSHLVLQLLVANSPRLPVLVGDEQTEARYNPGRDLGAARFWLQASELQRTRCLQRPPDSETARADINFYVVAIQRIREVARQSADRARVANAAAALNAFDAAWPKFKTLRNSEEHITGPGKDQPPYGIWYFSDVVVNIGPGGSVEFIVRVEETQQSVRTLVSDLEAALSAELARS